MTLRQWEGRDARLLVLQHRCRQQLAAVLVGHEDNDEVNAQRGAMKTAGQSMSRVTQLLDFVLLIMQHPSVHMPIETVCGMQQDCCADSCARAGKSLTKLLRQTLTRSCCSSGPAHITANSARLHLTRAEHNTTSRCTVDQRSPESASRHTVK